LECHMVDTQGYLGVVRVYIYIHIIYKEYTDAVINKL
jgi:hypothetical protein